ncbi:FXYD domain-containing ion transport regulator 3 isoform X3 [Manis javanica]|uniref:FXYD domain-containing ion transport regulator 3 isoform X3 n=1 Tax=Manis javanica TaxID=9974 RepID=UPI003C6D2745
MLRTGSQGVLAGHRAWRSPRKRRQPSNMQEVVLSLLIFLASLPALAANDPEDWHSLRVGGLICAAVLCTFGFIVLMSGKCKCKFGQKPSHRPGDSPPLITPGSTHNC